MSRTTVTCRECNKRTSLDIDESYGDIDVKWECANCNTVNVRAGGGAWGAPEDVETHVTVDGTTNVADKAGRRSSSADDDGN